MRGSRTSVSRNRCIRSVVFVGLLSAGPILTAPVWGQPQFPNPVYEVGTNPYGLVKADFDGDGIADLVASDYGYGPNSANLPAGGLAFLRGLGDGVFEEAVPISMLSGPASVLTADVNGDGRPDLLCESFSASYPNGIISLRLNLGGGAFAAEQLLVNGGGIDLRVGDFNGDGRPDFLLNAWDGQGYLVVHFGNGDGTFFAAPRFAVGSSFDTAVADVNEDGRDDVVMMSYPAGPSDPPRRIRVPAVPCGPRRRRVRRSCLEHLPLGRGQRLGRAFPDVLWTRRRDVRARTREPHVDRLRRGAGRREWRRFHRHPDDRRFRPHRAPGERRPHLFPGRRVCPRGLQRTEGRDRRLGGGRTSRRGGPVQFLRRGVHLRRQRRRHVRAQADRVPV